MIRISETVQLQSDAEAVWSEIGDFDSIAKWHPFVESVDANGNKRGAVRTAHAADGGKHVERLNHFDANDHVYRYEMVHTTLPVENYSGELRVDEDEPEASIVKWNVTFELADKADGNTVEMVRGFLKAGTNAIRERFEA